MRASQRLPSLGIAIGSAVALLAGLLLLGGCGRRAPQATDVFAPYRPAVKSEFQHDFTHMADAPRYALDVTVDADVSMLTGTAQIEVTNTTTDPWRFLVFRLYPALEQYGGDMTILSVLIDDRPATFVYQAENTAIRLDLPEALDPDRSLTAKLAWRLSIPTWTDSSSFYALFGHSQQMVSLPLFYPALAVYQPGPTYGTGHWWQEMGSVRGDAAFNVASLFAVTATLPSAMAPVASGTLVASEVLSDSAWTQHHWVTGPVREFFLHMSPVFSSAEMETYGTRIVSYWLPGQEAAGRAALNYAAAALRIYSDYFGDYPFRDLQIAPAPLSYRGMEYPQVLLFGVQLYGQFRNNLEILVAHEVAHQWWYQIVHNDPVTTPWLDEPLAEYSVRLYYELLHGNPKAELLELQRWAGPLDLLRTSEGDAPIGGAVDSYATGSQYETIVYAKGALFYSRLREILGDRQFRRFLRDYLERYRYQIVDVDAWRAAVAELGMPELDTLFEEWVGVAPPVQVGSAPPTPTAEPTAAAP
jgi:aminopeptidase N